MSVLPFTKKKYNIDREKEIIGKRENRSSLNLCLSESSSVSQACGLLLRHRLSFFTVVVVLKHLM